MARQESRQIVDLTIKDSDSNAYEVSSRIKSSRFPLRPVVVATSHIPQPPPPPPPSHIPPPRGAFVYTPRPGHNGPSAQDTAGKEGDPRPAKRQRTGEPEPGSSRNDVEVALGKCLELQVFPHIERATSNLSPDVYDLDKLGGEVIRRIVDRNFERQFTQGNGRLSSSAELTIAAGVHRLVTELSSGLNCRRSSQNSTPAPSDVTPAAPTNIEAPVMMPSVLPSIELDVDVHSDDDEDESEDDSEDESEDEDGDEDEDEDDDGEDEGQGEEEKEQVRQEEYDEYDEQDDEDQFEDEIDNVEIEEEDDDTNVAPVTPVPQSRIRTPPCRRPPKQKKARDPVSPQQLHTRAKANQWQSGKSYNGSPVSKPVHHSFGLPLRPYASALERQQIASGVARTFVPIAATHSSSQVFHVDFSDIETRYLQYVARKAYGRPAVDGERSTVRDIRNVLKKAPALRSTLVEIHVKGYVGYNSPPLSLTKRSASDVSNFLNDVYFRRLNRVPKSLFIEKSDTVAQGEASRANMVSTLLLSREITGNRLGATRTYQNFVTTVKSNREDYLEPQVEWTNCAGDIMTVSWLSNTDFVCGTTTHSDSHNQQYNKPGNLLLGSAATTTLRAYPDHRIVRPVVSSGDNALDSMVASQDPWLFTSVVSSDYDPTFDLAFTSSFDKTVKIWKRQDRSMTSLGTWEHGGHVNFVVASKDGRGTIATAADVPAEAVRVYYLDPTNISGSQYESYSCTRIHDEDYVPSEKWAYYPAAIRWGLGEGLKHLLLIGYSPRSPTGEDHEIPEDKRDTGELCLWDIKEKKQVKVNSAKTQNVFEVAWHPWHPIFAAATSASQVLERTDQSPRTQIRIFKYNKGTDQYSAMKSLDCIAIDINELSMMPNSIDYSYVAAGCTDGKVYVWDTAGSDMPICVLEHGDPVEELLGEREHEDVGVKFMAWATTADRLYTGSSDGVVKVWNVRHGIGTLVKDLIEVAAPITYGAFSPDFTKIVIGDGSGRVYLLALEDPEDEDPPPNPAQISAGFLNVQTSNGHRAIRRPRPFLPHPELPPPGAPSHNKLLEGQEKAREYLSTAQIVLHPDPTLGAVQGVNYAETSLFRNEAHFNEDPNEPLLATFQGKQQSYQRWTHQVDYHRAKSLWQVKQLNNDLLYNNRWRKDQYAHPNREPIDVDDDDSDESSDYQDASGGVAFQEPRNGTVELNNHPQSSEYHGIFDQATLEALKDEGAELDYSLDLDYETSILDSDDDEYLEVGSDE
ncbi:WD40 repeat-like protein [Nemania sp. FL0031]|nr:WD40 repeat-like protein [Nemania sp. FL0031]